MSEKDNFKTRLKIAKSKLKVSNFSTEQKKGSFIEKGGVAFSKVFGPVQNKMAEQLKLSGSDFFATGVSVVLHSRSANHPIIHMNVRYFEIDSETYWFGGGIDVTPSKKDLNLPESILFRPSIIISIILFTKIMQSFFVSPKSVCRLSAISSLVKLI